MKIVGNDDLMHEHVGMNLYCRCMNVVGESVANVNEKHSLYVIRYPGYTEDLWPNLRVRHTKANKCVSLRGTDKNTLNWNGKE